jgi:predicted porin
MQKKIIALAIASALTAPAMAFAEATVYGQADLSIDRINDGNTNSGTSYNLVSNESRIGLKGSEDAGNGMSVVWQVEAGIGMDTGNTTAGQLFNRNTYLGLSGAGMGTILAGRYDTPYKISTRRLDVFADTEAADNRGLAGISMMGAGHDVRRSNSLVYLSPSWGGFSLAAGTTFGAENAPSTATKGTALSLAGMYEAGPLYATLAYDSLKYGNFGALDGAAATPTARSVNDEDKAWKAGVGYAMDAITVNAVIEKPKFTQAIGGGSSSSTNLYLGGKFAISTTDAIKLAYTKRGDTSGATNNAKQYALGYDHNMSSNTTVYALYTKITDNTAGAADPSTISVGVKHSF